MSFPALKTCCAAVGIALLAVAPAYAQWSNNPATNLAIADAVGAQNNPHVVPISDGGFYVSWYDAAETGFDVRLQRLDADGKELWGHDGVLVADRDFQWVQDYGLTVDSMGRAMLAYRQKDANGVPQVEVTEVNQDGSMAWDPAHATLTSYPGPDGANRPMIAGTIASMAFVAWMGPQGGDGSIYLQRINAYAFPQWSQPKAETPPSGANYLADLRKANGSTGVILSWSAQLGQYDRELWTQRYSYAGAPEWNGGAPVKVYDGSDGEAMQYGYFPRFTLDASGGAVFTWYTVGLNAATVRVQHVDSTGASAFAQNGVRVTTDTTRLHGFPAGTYDSGTGNIYALWQDADASSQSQYTLYAQQIDSSGTLMWGNEGKVLVPTSGTELSQPVAMVTDGGDMLAAWASGTAPAAMTVHATRLGAVDGAAVWMPGVVDIGTGPRTAGRLQGATSSQGFTAFVWTSASSSGQDDIVAQNLRPDGQLGSDTIFKNGFDG
ncbi:MAG TPA: hypothetical protein VFN09_14265 [Rhodanobacteraceae bacterium]|nr:hypothetical protein [Rhodanobacteraceae bacterium]